MRNIAFNSALTAQPKTRNSVNQNWKNYETSIVLAVGGGLFFLLVGFFLQVIYTVFERNNSALNYAGIGSLVVAFIFFGISAHFMDKSEENKRRYERAESEKYK